MELSIALPAPRLPAPRLRGRHFLKTFRARFTFNSERRLIQDMREYSFGQAQKLGQGTSVIRTRYQRSECGHTT